MPPTRWPHALAPHGGIVLYRAFVYNHHLDWQRPQGRPRPRRLRHLPSPRRQVRRQRDRADQGRPHRLPGARARLAAVRRPRPHQPGHGSPDHPGVHRPAAPPRLPRAHVETGPRLRHARRESFHAREDDPRRQEPSISPGGMVGVAGVGRDSWLGSPLAMANLYAFGRLAWDPNSRPTRSPKSGPARPSATIRRSSAPSSKC